MTLPLYPIKYPTTTQTLYTLYPTARLLQSSASLPSATADAASISVASAVAAAVAAAAVVLGPLRNLTGQW